MIIKRLPTIAVFLAFSVTGLAQTSVIQDSKGETSLTIGTSQVVAINAKDESVSASFGWPVSSKPDTLAGYSRWKYMGGSAKVKAKSGVAPIFKGEDFQFNGNVGIFYFEDWTNHPKRQDLIFQWNVAANFTFNRYKLLDTLSGLAFDEQVYDKNNRGYKFELGINVIDPLGSKSNYLLGVAVNGGEKDNTDELSALEVSTYTTQMDTSGNMRIVQKSKKSAYDITKHKQELSFFNFNVDFGRQLGDRFLLLGHSRWSVLEGRAPQWNPAFGFYITKDGAPLEVITGIQVQVLDLFNTAASDKTRIDRTSLNIVAGYSF